MFLRIAFGGRYEDDRQRTFKDYMRWFYRNVAKVGTDLEVENELQDLIKRLKANGVPWLFVDDTLVEIGTWKRNRAIQQRRAAAKSRWEKEKAQKAIDRPQNPQK